MKPRIKKGDFVVVIAGKDKGKMGKILRLYPRSQRVLVEKVNLHIKHERPNPQQGVQGGRTEQELPIHISNVMYYCTNCEKGVRVKVRVTADGRKVRVCGNCGKELD